MRKMALLFSMLTALFYQAAPAAPFPRTPSIPPPSRAIQSDSKDVISYFPSATTFEQVKISEATVLNYDDKKTELKPVSYGLRKKKVFGLVPIKVYVIEFLSAHPNLIDKSEEHILASLKKSQTVQLKMTLSRDLAGKKITDSFKEALEANGVNVSQPSKEISEVINELSSIKEFKAGEAFSLVATWTDPKNATATLIIEKPDRSTKVISGDEKFITDLFSIWFGKPADEKLADLKKVLLK